MRPREEQKLAQDHTARQVETDPELLPFGHVILLSPPTYPPTPRKRTDPERPEIVRLRASPGWKSDVLAGAASGKMSTMGHASRECCGFPIAMFTSGHGTVV